MAKAIAKTRVSASSKSEKAVSPAPEVLSGEVSTGNYKIVALNTTDAEKGIRKIISSGANLRKLVHEIACGIMLHYIKHGDYSQLQRPIKDGEIDLSASPRLIEAVAGYKDAGKYNHPGAMSRSMGVALIRWITANSSLRYNEETKAFYHNNRDKRIAKGDKGFFDMSAMNVGKEFFNFEPDPVAPKKLSADEIIAMFSALAKRLDTIEKQATEGAKVGERKVIVKHDMPMNLITDFRNFVREHEIVKVAEES